MAVDHGIDRIDRRIVWQLLHFCRDFRVFSDHRLLGGRTLDRAGGRLGNKGAEAADAAVEMAGLMRTLPRTRR